MRQNSTPRLAVALLVVGIVAGVAGFVMVIRVAVSEGIEGTAWAWYVRAFMLGPLVAALGWQRPWDATYRRRGDP